MLPIGISLGWSRDDQNPASLAIRYLTRPGWRFGMSQWSHMFLVFHWTEGEARIHEALLSEGWASKPIGKLYHWIDRNPRNHHAALYPLEIDPATVAAIYKRSCGWLGTRSYSCKQIAAFALAESMIGRWLNLSIGTSETEIICSEGACQLVGEADPQWDLRRHKNQTWDSVSPQAAFDEFTRKQADFSRARLLALGRRFRSPTVEQVEAECLRFQAGASLSGPDPDAPLPP